MAKTLAQAEKRLRELCANHELTMIKVEMEEGTPYQARYKAAATRQKDSIRRWERRIAALEAENRKTTVLVEALAGEKG